MKPETDEPTFTRLKAFIETKMRMSHIYQPAMLGHLLRCGGASSVEDIAKAISAHDPSQTEYYSQITKNMVGKVLSDHQIVSKEKRGRRVSGFQLYGFGELTEQQVGELVDLCQAKLDEYLSARGQRAWSHRRKGVGTVSGTLKYEVLKRAKFRCELCGISAEEKALEVDHIIPRNHGGTDEISNLQALCYSCNAMKRDRDDTDFREIAASYRHREPGCVFCESEDRVMADGNEKLENELAFAIKDGFPVTKDHVLIIPKRHIESYFDLHQPELNAIHALVQSAKSLIDAMDSTVTGFNVGVNDGTTAGQTILHCHVHLIPRREGDLVDPRGGVRGVIPDKRIY